MKNKKLWMGVGAVVIVALVIWMCSGGKKEETVEFETAKAERQDIHTTITATGTIEPVTSVTVGTQVSGIVSKLYVDYNSVVKKGPVLKVRWPTRLPTSSATRRCLTRDWSAPTTTSQPSCRTRRLARRQPPVVRTCRRHRPTWAMPPSPHQLMA